MDQNQNDLLQGDAGQGDAADVPKTKVKKADAAKTSDAPLPDQVELAAPHGFIDESGAHRFWAAGAIVKAEEDIKLLLARLAPLVGITYKD